MMTTKSVKISIVPTPPSSDQYERNVADFSSIDHVLRISVEEIHRLIAPSWYTSKHIEDYNAEEDDDDIVQEVIQESSVDRDFGFSYNDIISRVYEKSVSDFILNIGFLSSTNAEYCVKFIENELFRRWVEKEMTDITNVKIVVLIRKETNGEELTEHEFDGEFKSVRDDNVEEEVEMAPAPALAPAPGQVEVEQEVIQIEDDEEAEMIQIEDDEEEEEVPVVEEEEDGDEARNQLMETVFGTNDYMEVEGVDNDLWLMVDDGEGGGIEEQQQWEEEYVEEEEDNNYWFGFSNGNGVSRDMIETLLKMREYDPKRNGDCMICMDGFSSKQEEEEEVAAVEMPCSHVFHKPCIVEWLELKNSCPLCRFEICNKDDDPH